MRFALEVAAAVRAVWPASKPLFMRISATDGSPDGWSIEDSTVLARELTALGIDAIHVSSGGFDGAGIKPGPLYQVPLSKAVRESGAKTIAVGLITDPRDAEHILSSGEADLVAFARGALEDDVVGGGRQRPGRQRWRRRRHAVAPHAGDRRPR